MNRTLLLCFLVFCFSSACADEPSKNEEKKSSPAVRESVLAGTWYPASKIELQSAIDRYLSNIPKKKQDAYPVRALIVPHAGYRWSGQTAAYAYKTVEGNLYERVIILAPSHRLSFQGASIPSVDAYETPLGRIPLDRQARDSLLKSKAFKSIAAAHSHEHSLEIQLPFLQRTLGDFTLIPIVVGQVQPKDVKAMADLIRPLLNKKTLLVMSSDFTHQGPRFGYRPFKEEIRKNVQRLDFAAINHILNLDVRGFWAFCDAVSATICGRDPIKIGMLALPAQTQVDFLHYETSGDEKKEYRETVSYAAIVFRYRQDYLNAKEQAVLLNAARKTVEDTLQEESIKAYQCKAREITERLKGKKGVFVTLHKKGRLRGCIGQFEGSEPLHRMIPKTALLSAFRDTRFQPLQKDELEDIDIEISVMSPMKSVESWQDIVLGRDGIRIEKAGKSALYLPQVALEQGWGVEETLAHLCEKAGLKSNDWKKNCHLKTFTAQVFGETYRELQEDKAQ